MVTTKIENSNGAIYISLHVIAQIAADAVSRCFGVVGLSQRGKAVPNNKRSGLPNADKGVRIQAKKSGLHIELSIVCEYGVNMREISNSIMHSVKYAVEHKTGFAVSEVVVNIEHIRVE